MPDEAVHRAVPAADAHGAGELFLDLDVQIHHRLLQPALGHDVHGLEEIEVVDPLVAPFERLLAVEVALVEAYFAADHLVPRFCVARNVDPADAHLAAFLDIEGKGHRLPVGFDVELRYDARKGRAMTS